MTHNIPPLQILEGIYPLHPPVVDAYVARPRLHYIYLYFTKNMVVSDRLGETCSAVKTLKFILLICRYKDAFKI